ncbi:hypothetical protein BASA81_010593 [Batrachochytrium salamandrivorans]|nr:hypothetical protein BASA81_010593 [Batrachochytrium salamandrivorans]
MEIRGVVATRCLVEAIGQGGAQEESLVLLEPGVVLCLGLLLREIAHREALEILALLVNKRVATVESIAQPSPDLVRVHFTLLPLSIRHVMLRGIAPYCVGKEEGELDPRAPEYTVESCFTLAVQWQKQQAESATSHSSTAATGPLQELPDALVCIVLGFLTSKELKQVRKTSSRMYRLGQEVSPPLLRTKLFPHQLRALNRMEQQEVLPPRFDPAVQLADECFMDRITGELWRNKPDEYCSKRGGLFCDQPGLGKTCTVLGLVLRSRGMVADESLNQCSGFSSTLAEKRKSPSRARRLESEQRLNQLLGVKTTLVVVPRTLLPHWHSQIALHAPALTVSAVDDANLPCAAAIAKLDVLLVSTSQMSHQAKLGANSFLQSVLFLRCVVDEGHSLGTGAETNYSVMLKELRTERIWIMTGTPAKMTNKAQSLRSLFQILSFLHATPANPVVAQKMLELATKCLQLEDRPAVFTALLAQHLLGPVLIRHTKEEIMAQLPQLVRTYTSLELNAAEKRQYNLLVGFIQTNLLLTSIGDKSAGWEQSLLNPLHRAKCLELVEQLRVTCTAGAIEAFRLQLRDKNRMETLALFSPESDEVKQALAEFLHRTSTGQRTRCCRCTLEYDFVLLSRCGHFTCPECFAEQQEQEQRRCLECDKEMDLDDFAYIQPGFDLERFLNHHHGNEATKADYLIRQIELERRAHPGAKFIVFSQFPLVRNYIGDALIRKFGADGVAEFWGQYRKYELEKFTLGRLEVWQCAACGRMNGDMVAKTCGLATALLDHAITGRRVLNPDLVIEHWAAQPVVGSVVRFLDGVSAPGVLMGIKPCRGRRANATLVQQRHVNCDILLLGKDGSVGLDISLATHVFLTEYVWDSALEDQIISRAWRLGNRSPKVKVEQLVMKDTVEEILKNFAGSSGGDNGEEEEMDRENSDYDPRIKAILAQVRLLK